MKDISYKSCWHTLEEGLFRSLALTTTLSEGAFMSLFDSFMTEYLRIRMFNARPLVAVSGGVDSTYLLAKCVQLFGRDGVEAINVRGSGYSESKEAYETCQALGVRLHEEEFNASEVVVPMIEELGMPIDRGSTIPVYVMCKWAEVNDMDLIVGDSADCVFAPGMSSHVRIMEHGEDPYPKPNMSVLTLFNNAKKVALFEKYHHVDPIHEAMLFDALHEIPYYYRMRYQQFSPGTRVILPYQHPAILSRAMCADIHRVTSPVKMPLRNLTYEILLDKCDIMPETARRLTQRPKKALKIEASSLESVISRWAHVPHDEPLFNQNCRVAELSPETQYTLALFNIWLDKVWYNR